MKKIFVMLMSVFLFALASNATLKNISFEKTLICKAKNNHNLLKQKKTTNESFKLNWYRTGIEIEVYTICGTIWYGTVYIEGTVLTETQFHVAANWADYHDCGYSYDYVP